MPALPVISTGGAKRRSGEISPTPIVIRAKRLSPHCHFDRSGCASTLSFRAERPIGREVEKSHLHSRGLLMPTSKSLCRKRSFVAPAQSTADENFRLGYIRARRLTRTYVWGTRFEPEPTNLGHLRQKYTFVAHARRHKRTSQPDTCVKCATNEHLRQVHA